MRQVGMDGCGILVWHVQNYTEFTIVLVVVVSCLISGARQILVELL